MEPIILSLGAAFAALGLKEKTSHDFQLFNDKVWSKKELESEAIVNKA